MDLKNQDSQIKNPNNQELQKSGTTNIFKFFNT